MGVYCPVMFCYAFGMYEGLYGCLL